jgi:LemA protein
MDYMLGVGGSGILRFKLVILQRGGFRMKKGLVIALVLVAALALFGISLVSVVIGTYNTLVTQEEGLEAQYSQNQNNYDNMWKKFKETAAVPDMYTSDLKKVYEATLTARYGEEGSQAAFQFIQEHNPNIDAGVYKQLQQVIEAGRNSFETNQKTLLDKKRLYKNELRTFPNNLIAGAMGFPKIDLEKIDIVTSADTAAAFSSKKTEEIKLRN